MLRCSLSHCRRRHESLGRERTGTLPPRPLLLRAAPTLLSWGQALGFPGTSLARLPCSPLAPAHGYVSILGQSSGLWLPCLPRTLSSSGPPAAEGNCPR